MNSLIPTILKELLLESKLRFVIQYYIIIRFHPGFSLVKNCDLLEDRCMLMPFQRLANHCNFRIINSQWRALFMITSNGMLKSFRCTTKLILAKIFTFLL